MTEREIIREMFRRYPVTDYERRCAAEKRRRDRLREQVRLRLENEQNRTEKICEIHGTQKQEMGEHFLSKGSEGNKTGNQFFD